jgi:hypothetical protein
MRMLESTGAPVGDDTDGVKGDSHAAVTSAKQKTTNHFHRITASRYQGVVCGEKCERPT